MMHAIRLFVIIVAIMVAPAQPFAQSWFDSGDLLGGDGEGGGSSFFDEVEEPATELPPLPKVEEDPSGPEEDVGYTMVFPDLPPSRVCRKRDILGLWKLRLVYETPAGLELEDFGEYPYQYMMFNSDSTFRNFKSAYDENTDVEVLREMQKPNVNVLEQYVVHKVDGNAVIYLYKDGVAIYNMACFIVADPTNPFEKGQMLFMPPPERATMRMVKAYDKLFSAPKKKKKKKRRRRRK